MVHIKQTFSSTSKYHFESIQYKKKQIPLHIKRMLFTRKASCALLWPIGRYNGDSIFLCRSTSKYKVIYFVPELAPLFSQCNGLQYVSTICQCHGKPLNFLSFARSHSCSGSSLCTMSAKLGKVFCSISPSRMSWEWCNAQRYMHIMAFL